jgi:putative MATE family efflux protein
MLNTYEHQLAEAPVFRLLLKFSLPAIMSFVVTWIMNMVISIYLGNNPSVGPIGLAALSVCFPFQMILATFGVLFGIGGSILFSLSLGRGDRAEAGRVLGTSLVALAAVGVAGAVLVNLFARDLLTAFGASEAVLPYAEQYIRIYMSFGFATALSAGGNVFVRADGKPTLSMLFSIIGGLFNAIVGYVLIDILDMGMAGAACSIIGSQLVIMTMTLIYFTSRKANIRLTAANLRPKFRLIPRIAAIGLAQSLLSLSSSVLFTILNTSFFRYGGDMAVSGMGVINPLQQLALTPVQGLVMGAAPLLSFNFGAKKIHRVLSLLKIEIVGATIFATLSFLVVQLFPAQVIGIFTHSPELISYGSKALPIWFTCFPLVGFQIVCANFFQASGRAPKAILLTLIRQVLFLIPLAMLLPVRMGLNGILTAAPVADALSAILVAILIFLEWRKLKKSENSLNLPVSVQ